MKIMLKNYFVPHTENDYNPHFFRNTSIMFLAIIVLATLSLSIIGSKTIKEEDLLSAIYASVLSDLTNTDRVSQNLQSLKVNETLERAAEMKADDMVEKSYFAHTSPEGLSPWYWFGKAGYSFIYAGENLAVNFSESDAVEKAWMASPLHRANILNSNFTEIGIAVKEGYFQGRPTIYVVQMFGKPAVVVAQNQPANEVTENVPIAVNVPTPSVRGESLEIIDEQNAPDGQSIYVAVENVGAEPEQAVVNENTDNNSESIVGSKFALRFPVAIQTLYYVLGALVALAIIMLVLIEIKHQRPKSIALGTLLLLFIGLSIYANSTTELYKIALMF